MVTQTHLSARALSFCGGGTDLPEYVDQRGRGSVVSVTTDRRVRAWATRADSTEIASPDLGLFGTGRTIDEIEQREPRLTLLTTALRAGGIDRGIHLHVEADVPRESGLGLSSATVVAVLALAGELNGEPVEPAALAEAAFHVERVGIGDRLGRQDHYAAAFGGFNRFDFGPDGTTDVHPIDLDDHTINHLDQHLMLFVTPLRGRSNAVLSPQAHQVAGADLDAMTALDAMLGRCDEAERHLRTCNIHGLAALLHDTWMLKRSITPDVATSDLDRWYASATAAGALGGKVTGAGGRGSLLLVAEPEHQPSVTAALCGPLHHVPFHLPLQPTVPAERER